MSEPVVPSAHRWLAVAALVIASSLAACSPSTPVAPAGNATPADPDEAPLLPPEYESSLPEGVKDSLYKPFTGDLDQMVEHRLIRVGVTFNRTFYYVDMGVQRGLAFEMGRAFEDELNKKLKTTNATRVHVFFVPLSRDALAAALTEGRVDLVVGQVTIRPELQALADFSNPTRTNVNEVVVTGPASPAIASIDDLSGKDVHARRDSAAWVSVLALNDTLKAKGRPPVVLREVPGRLEDDDLLEMVNAGLIPIVVVDDYLAEFWKKIFTDLTVHNTVVLRSGASLGVPFRKNSPRLAAELNAFLAKYGIGTAFGNMIEKRYLVNTTYAKRATSESERKKFLELVSLFRKYGEQYQMDYLLMAAQGYQESQLDNNAKSHVGAIGIMQVMPATGKELNVGDITQIDNNINAGVKYMRFMIDRYYANEPMDQLNKGLFAFASYNAGPGRIRQLRREAEKKGLDPNLWFGNVEQIASERIGRETVTYVANIYKYYVAYRLLADEVARRAEAKEGMKPGAR